MKLLPLLFTVLFAFSLDVVSAPAPTPYVYSASELMSLKSLPTGNILVKGTITKVLGGDLIKNAPVKIDLDKSLRCEVTVGQGLMKPHEFTFKAGMPVQISGVFVQKGDRVTLKGTAIPMSRL